MKAFAFRDSIDEILSYFDEIKTIELAMESLPYESIAYWRDSVRIREQRERMETEIVQLRSMLRRKMSS